LGCVWRGLFDIFLLQVTILDAHSMLLTVCSWYFCLAGGNILILCLG
jgi:hypothetical protein